MSQGRSKRRGFNSGSPADPKSFAADRFAMVTNQGNTSKSLDSEYRQMRVCIMFVLWASLFVIPVGLIVAAPISDLTWMLLVQWLLVLSAIHFYFFALELLKAMALGVVFLMMLVFAIPLAPIFVLTGHLAVLGKLFSKAWDVVGSVALDEMKETAGRIADIIG